LNAKRQTVNPERLAAEREQLGKKVGIPQSAKKTSRALLPHTDFIKQIRAV
jgi:hypothetical protein